MSSHDTMTPSDDGLSEQLGILQVQQAHIHNCETCMNITGYRASKHTICTGCCTLKEKSAFSLTQLEEIDPVCIHCNAKRDLLFAHLQGELFYEEEQKKKSDRVLGEISVNKPNPVKQSGFKKNKPSPWAKPKRFLPRIELPASWLNSEEEDEFLTVRQMHFLALGYSLEDITTPKSADYLSW